jgi:hypothetical protein
VSSAWVGLSLIHFLSVSWSNNRSVPSFERSGHCYLTILPLNYFHVAYRSFSIIKFINRTIHLFQDVHSTCMHSCTHACGRKWMNCTADPSKEFNIIYKLETRYPSISCYMCSKYWCVCYLAVALVFEMTLMAKNHYVKILAVGGRSGCSDSSMLCITSCFGTM